MILMRQVRRWQRILILCLLSVSVFAPVVLFSQRLKSLASIGRREFVEDLSSIKYRSDYYRLNAVKQEEGESLKGPKHVLYKDEDQGIVVSYSSSDQDVESKQSGSIIGTVNISGVNGTNHGSRDEKKAVLQKIESSKQVEQEKSNQVNAQHDKNVHPRSRRATSEKSSQSQSRRATYEKVMEIKDKLIRAKVYLAFSPPGSKSHLVKELRTRMRELERALGDATKDSDVSKSALNKMKSMDASLFKASSLYSDCTAMANKLRAMTYNAEENVRAQSNQESYLVQLASRTTPKGLHCLSMRLTAEYFALDPESRQLPNQWKLHNPDLYHYAVFSDNVLASSVVVSSTVSSAMEPEKIVFHVITDSLNHPAISMWFLLNPPGKATVDIQSMDNFDWLSSKYDTTLKKRNSLDPRFNSPLNHLRFYLPDVFPTLNKIVFFDHDVVVQRDLSKLWSVDMEGKVNGAVETCEEGEPSFHRMDMLINFTDPWVAKKFDAYACTWAFGMNLFDLHEWRKQNLTSVYHRYVQMGFRRPLWKAGSLPLGWATFYNQTMSLDKRWHTLGLGDESGVVQADIERAAVIHYDGVMKPWLDIGIAKYKGYWNKYVNYNHPHLQQCNIHG